jgi:hypothetical protein
VKARRLGPPCWDLGRLERCRALPIPVTSLLQSFQPQPQAAARYGRLQVYWNLQQAFSEISAYQAEHTI